MKTIFQGLHRGPPSIEVISLMRHSRTSHHGEVKAAEVRIYFSSLSPGLSGEVLKRLESTEPESTKPESTEPESMEPESTEPESREPESMESESM